MVRTALIAALALAPGGGLLAQAVGVPPIEQEPRPGVVRERERSDGILPSPRQQGQRGQEVDRLYRDLTGENPNTNRPAPPPPAFATPQQDARESDQVYQQLMGQSPNAPPRGPMPPQGPPMSSQAGAVDQLYRDMTGQNPATAR
jgi:hypothetical protein